MTKYEELQAERQRVEVVRVKLDEFINSLKLEFDISPSDHKDFTDIAKRLVKRQTRSLRSLAEQI